MKKYPRTYHFQFSQEVHDDDKVIQLHYLGNFLNDEIIITEKIDGGNSCWKPNEGVFARSHQLPTSEPWFDYLKGIYYSKLADLNPDYWIFGENTFAIHSIEYSDLESYFYIFNIYDTKRKMWLSWDDVEAEAQRIGVPTVPVIYRGKIESMGWLAKWMEREMQKPSLLGGKKEGFVARVASEIPLDEFQQKVAKYVRKGHVQTDEHWTKNWKKQELKK